MSSLLNESEIRGLGKKRSVQKALTESFAKTASRKGNDIFLSHSHEDVNLVDDVVAWFDTLSMNVYVDWRDPTMPPETSEETAERLKLRILECRAFLLLATNRALTSRWIPWELGFSDATKSPLGTVILPLEDSSGTWKGSEYLRLYPSIHRTEKGWAVFQPGKDVGGVYLRDYFSSI